jgi:hypothetical protein
VTWIKTIPAEEAQGTLRESYEAVYALLPEEYKTEVQAVVRPDGSADSIAAAHSLIPDALRHALSTHGVLIDERLPLSRRQHEMIATVVSTLNRCFY